jgi:hypothetical protein
LRHAEPLGCLREALQLDDRAECAKLTRIHKQTLSAEDTLPARIRHTSARISSLRSLSGGGQGWPRPEPISRACTGRGERL